MLESKQRTGTRMARPAIPMVRAKKLAAQINADELARARRNFSPTRSLRNPALDYLGVATVSARASIYRECWRWAAQQHVRKKYHLDIVLNRAAITAENDESVQNQAKALECLNRAHYRLGMFYFQNREYELADKHLGQLIVINKSHSHARYMQANFWWARARCDVELYRSVPGKAEDRLRAALQSYRMCFNSIPVGNAAVRVAPKLFLELAALYENFGAFAGALYFLNIVIEFFRRTPWFEDAAFRCALILKHVSTLPGAKLERERLLSSCIELLETLRQKDELGEEMEDADPTRTSFRHAKYRDHLVATLLYARACQALACAVAEEEFDDDKSANMVANWTLRAYTAFYELFILRQSKMCSDATIFSPGPVGLRAWLGARSTWFALSTELMDMREPALAADMCEIGLAFTTKWSMQQDSPSIRKPFEQHPDDNIGLLLQARVAYAELFDVERARRCAMQAFAVSELDMRARAAVAECDPAARERFKWEDNAADCIRRAWRCRIWRCPFQQALRQHIIARAEAAIARDRFGALAARRDLAYFAVTKWRPLLLHEARCCIRVQRFLRHYLPHKKQQALLLSRHLRAVGTALSRWRQSPWHPSFRCDVVRLALSEVTPISHRARINAQLIEEQDNATLYLQRIIRGFITRKAQPEYYVKTTLRANETADYVDGPAMPPMMNAADDVPMHEDGGNLSRIDFSAARSIQSYLRRHFARTTVLKLKADREGAAAAVLCRYLRRWKIQQQAAHVQFVQSEASRVIATFMQRAVRFRLGRQRECAAIALQRQERGRRARFSLRVKRAQRARSQTTSYEWGHLVAKQRIRLLLDIVRAKQYSRTPRSLAASKALERLTRLAMDDAMIATQKMAVGERLAAGLKRVPSMNSAQVWPTFGIPGTPAFNWVIKRRALVIAFVREEARNRRDSGTVSWKEDCLNVPLFALYLRHWTCSLCTLALCDASASIGNDVPAAEVLLKSVSNCRSLRELAIVNCSLGARTVATFFVGITAGAVGLAHFVFDQDFLPMSYGHSSANAGTSIENFPSAKITEKSPYASEVARCLDVNKRGVASHYDIGCCAAYALGDLVYQKVGCLRSLALCRCKVGDAGASSLGEALAVALIEELDLDENEISDDGACGLATGMLSGKRLLQLSLRRNFITTDGARQLVLTLVEREFSLQHLALQDNFIGEDFLDAVLGHKVALSRHPAVPRLDMTGNTWRKKNLERLQAFLEDVRKLGVSRKKSQEKKLYGSGFQHRWLMSAKIKQPPRRKGRSYVAAQSL